MQRAFFAVRLLGDGLGVLHVSHDVLCLLKYETLWDLRCMVVCCTYEIGWSVMLYMLYGVLCCAYEIRWSAMLHLMYGVLRVRMRYDGLR